jgi:NADH-quinone oxidoreductase subunit E
MRPVKHLIPEFEKLRERFPAGFDSSLVLPCLHRIQHERGYVSDSDVEALTQYLGVPKIQIEEVLSFYTMFRRKPIGRWHLQMCHNVSCSMRGAESILSHVQRKLGIAPGQTTPDGRYTLSTAECLGSCGTAPMMMVNEAYHENLTPAKLDELLEGLK